jgi:integrase
MIGVRAMASIRRRVWRTTSGETREAWVADYTDGAGKRRLETFKRQRDAKAWLAQTQVDVKEGKHVADSASITVAAAAELWLWLCREGSPDGEHPPVRPSTLKEYERHVGYITDAEIGIGQVKLTKLDRAMVDAFLRRLREAGRNPPMVRKTRTTLASIITHAQDINKVGRNVIREQRRRRGGQHDAKEILIPTKEQIRAMLAAEGALWWRTFLTMAIHTGMRASELRGLPWAKVDLEQGVVQVRQMADFKGAIQPTKSKAGERDIVMTPTVRRLLQELKMEQGRPSDGLVFATRTGRARNHGNLFRAFYKLQDDLGISPKFGLHALRHAAASLFIEQGWTSKKVQTVMGHSSIQMTYDTYGKLFKDKEGDQAAMAKLDASLS